MKVSRCFSYFVFFFRSCRIHGVGGEFEPWNVFYFARLTGEPGVTLWRCAGRTCDAKLFRKCYQVGKVRLAGLAWPGSEGACLPACLAGCLPACQRACRKCHAFATNLLRPVAAGCCGEIRLAAVWPTQARALQYLNPRQGRTGQDRAALHGHIIAWLWSAYTLNLSFGFL